MPKKRVSNEIRLIYLCAQLKMDASAKQHLQEILESPLNWDQIIAQAYSHRMLPLIYYSINEIHKPKVPEAILNLLKDFCRVNLIKNMRLWEEFCRIQDALKKAGVKVIPLKGIILSETLYHNLGLRPMADIDILVKVSDLACAKNALISLGYKISLQGLTENYWKDYHCHYRFRDPFKETFIEIHWAFAPPRPNKINLDEVWIRSKIQCINGIEVLTLSPEDTLLLLCLHACKNITTLQNIPLINLCDIHELISQYTDRLNWDYIAHRAKVWRLKGALFYLCLLTNNRLGTHWPAKIKTALTPQILHKIILNFYTAKLTKFSHLEITLVMLTMLDTFKDRFSLILQRIFTFYQKGKIFFNSRLKT